MERAAVRPGLRYSVLKVGLVPQCWNWQTDVASTHVPNSGIRVRSSAGAPNLLLTKIYAVIILEMPKNLKRSVKRLNRPSRGKIDH